MPGIWLLILIVLTVLEVMRSKSRREQDCHFDQAAELEAAIPPRPLKSVVIPPLPERVDSCYESLEQLQVSGRRWTSMNAGSIPCRRTRSWSMRSTRPTA